MYANKEKIHLKIDREKIEQKKKERNGKKKSPNISQK
jgi:hypothetical protein